MFRWVKIASWIELGLFAILLIVWLAPGLEHPTFYAGLRTESASSHWRS